MKKPDYKDFEKYLDVKPKMFKFFGKFKEAPYKVGDYRTLPKGTEVRSIEYQTMISFGDDEIIEVTHTTVYGDLFFGKLKYLTGQTMFPGLIDKGSSEIETCFSKNNRFYNTKTRNICTRINQR